MISFFEAAKATPCRITIIGGSGSVGAYFTYKFLEAGHHVSIIGRKDSAHLQKISQEGLTLKTHDETMINLASNRFHYIGDAASFPQDEIQNLVIICVKQYDMSAEMAQMVAQITDEHSVIGVITNGLPFYFLRGLDSGHLESVDPGGAISKAFANRQIMGIQPVIAAQVISPGLIHIHRPLEAITVCLGTPEERHSGKIAQMNTLFNHTQIKTTYLTSGLRKNILEKLQFALAINTLSALLEQNLGDVFDAARTQSLIRYVVELTNYMAMALGIDDLRSYTQLKALAITKGHFSSLYHDIIKAGRVGEIKAIVESSRELATQLQQVEATSMIDLSPLSLLSNLLYKKVNKEIVEPSEIDGLFVQCQNAVDEFECLVQCVFS